LHIFRENSSLKTPARETLAPHPGLLLHDIARLFRQCFSQRLRDLGLSEPQWRVLGSVNKFPGITQTQLAQLLGIGKAPLGKLIDRLEAEGLLGREPDPDDRRLRHIHITESAGPVCEEIVRRYLEFQDCYLQNLSAPGLEELESSLRIMHRNMSEESGTALEPGIMESLNLMHLITGISRLNSRHFDLQLKALGFTRSQWLVLSAIDRGEGSNQSALAGELNMARAPLGVLVDELEAGNWVERRVPPGDRRARTLHLTGECRRKLQSLGESFEILHQRSLVGVAKPDRQSLSASLTRIRDQLKSLASAPEEVGK
jgi:DNA-binding MarR family transcriptional regulator